MRSFPLTVLLLLLSSVFMTFAWYAHLRDLSAKPWYIADVVSWSIAFFKYVLQVPANRIGFQTLELGQLKIFQEVITLTVIVPFALFYMKEPLRPTFSGPACACWVRFISCFEANHQPRRVLLPSAPC